MAAIVEKSLQANQAQAPPPTEKAIELEYAIGFGGSVLNGFVEHPDGVHQIYPLGSTVVVRHKLQPNGKKCNQTFLHGHSNAISCIAISRSGKYIASGQMTHMGFQAEIIIWDFEKRKLVYRLALHKVKVQAVAFSPSDKYLASLGGEDDNSVIVWDLATGKAICGAMASAASCGVANCLAYLNKDENRFVTGGASTLRVWELFLAQRKVKAVDCQTGQIKRVVKCCTVDEDDEHMYCGTTSGDVLQVNIHTKLFKASGPPKEEDHFSLGVLCATISPDKQSIVVGCGDGTIAVLRMGKLTVIKKAQLAGKVTSITFDTQSKGGTEKPAAGEHKPDPSEHPAPAGSEGAPTAAGKHAPAPAAAAAAQPGSSAPKKVIIYAGTGNSNIYKIDMETFVPEMLSTCHYSQVNDICFPLNCSEVFATASDTDIRVWNATDFSELLRITVPNLECKCIVFRQSGSSLLSGWTDGKIRSFGPQSGRLQYEINDAHKRGVTALAVSKAYNDRGDFKAISGGEDGQVRVWKITRTTQILETAMKEHKGTVTCVQLRKNNLECVSSSSDGSCIIWDLTRFVRNQVLFAPSFFKAVLYYPEENQLLTAGTDRKVAYWEAYDGSLIRELEASQSDCINGLDISADGQYFVLGGSDKLVKVYRYEIGDVVAIGVGHSMDINKVRLSPDQRHIITVSADGAIFYWKYPFEVQPAPGPDQEH